MKTHTSQGFTMTTTLDDKEPVHSYLDDIKYQTVKENNKRTSFVSHDHKILTQSAQAIRNIEKLERLTTADFRRQENAYQQKLAKLLELKEKRRNSKESTSSLSSNARRHSAPTVFWAHVPDNETANLSAQPPTRDSTNRRLSLDRSRTNVSNTKSSSISIHTSGDPKVRNDPPVSSLGPRLAIKPSAEARRLSYDLQQETIAAALSKLDMIVKNRGRRATISAGVQSDLPMLPKVKQDSIERSSSITEEPGFAG